MKKFLFLLMLTFSTVVFSQLTEKVYIYKVATIITEAKSDTYSVPTTVSYFYQNEAVVKVSFKGSDFYYSITSEPIKKSQDGLAYYQFYVKDSAGNTIVMFVFDNIGKNGCMFSDGKTAISYSNNLD